MEYFHISVFYPPPEGLGHGGLQNKNSHHQGSRGFQKIKPPTHTRRSPTKGGGVIFTIFERNLQTALCTEIYKYGQNLAIMCLRIVFDMLKVKSPVRGFWHWNSPQARVETQSPILHPGQVGDSPWPQFSQRRDAILSSMKMHKCDQIFSGRYRSD